MLVNNAGIPRASSFFELTVEEWDRIMAVNVRGVFLCCRAVLPAMIERGAGSIVNISSGAGMHGGVGNLVRCIEGASISEASRHVRKKTHDLARDVHCVDTQRCQRRVRLVPANPAAVALFALVRNNEPHPGRFSDNAT